MRRLRDHDKGEKDSSPLDKIFGEADVQEEEPEEKPEEEIEITHYGKTGGTGAVRNGVFQGVSLDSSAAVEPGGLQGDAARELSDKDLTVLPEERGPSAAPIRRSPAGNPEERITLKTNDQTKIEYLKLIVSLAEDDYYDQAIDALRELRELTGRGR
ncbi:MAG: hypothetical protein ACE5JA_05055 [bacterium]